MSHIFEPARDAQSETDKPRRGPAIVLMAVASSGILADRIRPLPLDFWLALTAVALIFWILTVVDVLPRLFSDWKPPSSSMDDPRISRFGFSPTLSVAALLIGWFCLSAAWHHWRWDCRAADDIANSATDEPQLVRLIGKVSQTPWIVRHPDGERAHWQSPAYTTLIVECRSLRTGGTASLPALHGKGDQTPTQSGSTRTTSTTGGGQAGQAPFFVQFASMPVSGNVRVSVDGELSQAALGDVIEVIGELVRPIEPANPGDFDQRRFLRAQGVFALVRSNSVECVTRLDRERGIGDWLLVFRSAVRQRAEQLIASQMGSQTAPVAQAMLLGSRVQIDDETRRAFRESGMLHILAISGMNVGLLWSWLWAVGRLSGRSAQASIWIVLIGLPLYAMITDANPPIVRATVVAVIVAFGRLIGRTDAVGNSLALAGLAVLAWNPSDLFNTGAQLSFLAVFAILHAMNWLKRLHEQLASQKDDAPLVDSYMRYAWIRLRQMTFDASVVGMAVWMMTSPLIASEFHLVSPIGSVLTVLLAIPVTILFWIGYSFLLLGFVSSTAFGWLGTLFDFGLRGFLWTVNASASWNAGHAYVPSPPVWWTIAFYGLTLLPVVLFRNGRWGTVISVRAGLAWMVFGLAWGLGQPPHPGVTCTFISVGHGLSVLIECPNGRTILYDAGGMVGGNATARTISQTMWVTGRARVDAVVLSHADGDHCNALPELSRIVSPGELFVHASFLDWKQPAVVDAIERSATAGTAVRLISAEQSLVFDPQVSFRVLHPSREFRSLHDNPNSLVVCLEYAGRRIVLTGDLELEGLERLLKTPQIDADVLLSPHHGSLKANPPDLARWATPEYVIVSTPERQVAERLATRYGPESQILTTATYGAIKCQIDPGGDLQVTTFKNRRR